MKEFLKNLTEYMKWANYRTLDSLKKNPINSAVELFGHIVTTEEIYFKRISEKDLSSQFFWPTLTIDGIEDLIRLNYENFISFVNNRSDEDLLQTVNYQDSKGTDHRTAINEMIIHLAMHGEHHRGQIARIVREAGGEPPVTDYIYFTRYRDA